MLPLKPDMASLSTGSCNFPTRVYENSPELVDWLAENVHAKASYLSTRELLIAATGRALDPAVFKTHLRSRYLP